MTATWRAVLLAIAALLSCACGGGEAVIAVDGWTASFPGAAPAPVHLPARFDRQLPQEKTSYALESTVRLPLEMQGRPLTFVIRHLPALATLYVDGAEATLLDPSALDVYRRAGPQRWRVPAEATKDGAIALRLEVEHAWTQSAWILATPELHASLTGGARLAAVSAFNAGAAAFAITAATFVVLLFGFLSLSLAGRRRLAYGLFALGGAAGLFYPAFLLGLTQPIFGVYDAPIVAVMLSVAAVAAIHFSHAYFDLKPPHAAWRFVPLVAAGAALAAHDPFTASHFLGPIVVVITLLNAAVQVLLLVRLARGKPRPRNLYLIVLAWPATAILGVPDFVAWLGAGDVLMGLRTASVGMTLICVLQAAALSREHLLSLGHADELNTELAARVSMLESKHREVEVLNDELKRQIAARTRQLAESFVADAEVVHEPVEALDPGDLVQERYRVARMIGTGGMGAVYDVERLADKKHFALKVLSVMSDGAARARFAREAQAAATVSHPNVVSIVDFDVAKEGYLFLVMELVEGNTLLEVRRRHRDVPWTLYVLAQVAAGLDAVHAKGIVHRDLKPGNVLLSRGADGRRPLVKITDFGISSMVDERASMALRAALPLPPTTDPPGHAEDPDPLGDAPTEIEVDSSKMPTVANDTPAPKRTPNAPLTETGVVFGTPSYMAAELYHGTKMATRSADVYSLAVIAFELLTGRRPFRESPLAAMMEGRDLPAAMPFRTACPSLDPAVAKLLDRAIGHDPSARPTARELALAFRSACEPTQPPAT
jgi:serine/threonine-protein kinase